MFAAHLQKAVDPFRGKTHRATRLSAWRHPVPLGQPAAPQRRRNYLLRVAVPQSIAVAQKQPPMNDTVPRAHGWRSSSFRCHWTSAFPSGPQIATKTSSRNAAAASSARGVRSVVETVPLPVTAFVVARICARHHPLARKREPDCLARISPSPISLPLESVRLLLAALSQTSAFQSPG